MAEADGQDDGIEEPEVLVARCTAHIGADWPTWLAREMRARDEQWQAVAAAARQEGRIEAVRMAARQVCQSCADGMRPYRRMLSSRLGSQWSHEYPDGRTYGCDAGEIWSEAEDSGWLPAPAQSGDEGAGEEGRCWN